MSRFPIRALALAAAVSVAACGTVPITSIPQLSRIDGNTTDFSALRVAVRLPDAIRPRPSGVALQAKVKIAGSPDVEEQFILVESEDPADKDGLDPSGNGFTTYAFRLSDADMARFEALRLGIRKAAAERRKGQLSLGIAVEEFCRAATPPPGPLLATTWLRTSETRSYVVVTRDVDLLGEKALKGAFASLDPC